MILITGGLGFIGSHTARALLDRGESCVLVQRRAPGKPSALLLEASGERLFVERADATDLRALLEIGERHQVTGVLHLAGAYFGDAVADARADVNALLNIVQAAASWGVARVGIASSIGVYDGGGENPLREDQPLPLGAHHSIASAKKIGEILASHLGPAVGVQIYAARIGAIWGPLGRTASRFFATPQLVHAAVAGRKADPSTLPGGRAPYAEEGFDMLYAPDCGRALAALQLAERLEHRVYNVAAGRVTTYRELADALAAALPGAPLDLAQSHDPRLMFPQSWLDISRLREDTGYQPAHDTASAVAEYVAWLRAGNER